MKPNPAAAHHLAKGGAPSRPPHQDLLNLLPHYDSDSERKLTREQVLEVLSKDIMTMDPNIVLTIQ